MKPLIYLFALLFLLSAASVSCDRPEEPLENSSGSLPLSDSLETVLLERVKSYYADFSSRDWNRYADHFWPGAHLTTVWQPPGADSLEVTMTTIEEFIAQADQGPGSQPVFEEKMIDAKVQAYNNLATVWATYAATFGSKDSLMEWQGIDAFTYMKHEGQWRIIALGYTQMDSD